ncbi:MAG: hypothetical protein ACI9VM_000202 [Candidatus Azotimanducaceae bacterium]|jgi:hypothetical protein
MKNANYTFETILANSNLTDENKQLLSESFRKMSDQERLTFVTLAEDDHNKLEVAVQFLNEFSSQDQLKSLNTEEYLLSITQ